MEEPMPTRLIELVENLPRKRIALLGDFMVDRYLYGNAERISPEAPVPILHFVNEDLKLGGAGSVAANIVALNGEVRPVGIAGDDPMGQSLRALLAQVGCSDSGILSVPGRPTTCKMRLVGSAQHRHVQQIIRMDFEQPTACDAATEQRLIAALTAALAGADLLAIEDYDKGVVTPAVCRAAIQAANRANIEVIIDPAKISDYSKYIGATAVKPNRPEVELATGLPARNEGEYANAAHRLIERLGLEAAIVTLDKSGAYLSTRDGQNRWLKTKPRQVFDAMGAGDMVLAALVVARAAGASWEEAVTLANTAGGLEVERFGAVPVTPQEILQELLTEVHEHLGKQRTLEKLLPELARHRATGKRVVFTNGCFDLLHLGHVKYFQFAKAQGDLLVVGVNTDKGIRQLKGPKRPVMAQEDRLGVLEELESIDYLITFDDPTPEALIHAINPHVLVKGADYAKQDVVGHEFVEQNGGRIALAPLIDGRSTSAVIKRILETCQ
jgi:D-beta-D-heptose 7-phosphate kinase/D-beta-D-heptose 1-phosphate adenosyltransferase